MTTRLYRFGRFLQSLRVCAGVLGGALVLWAAAVGVAAQPSQDKLRESLVKAAFLHKFASFVEWPQGQFEGPYSPLKIGIQGNDAVWQDLADLARDRDRDGRPVIVTRLVEGDSLAGFHILYLNASPARMTELLQRVPEAVLTVTDSEGVHPRGSVISLSVEEGRLRFGVSLETATRQRLRLSPRLLALSRNVQ